MTMDASCPYPIPSTFPSTTPIHSLVPDIPPLPDEPATVYGDASQTPLPHTNYSLPDDDGSVSPSQNPTATINNPVHAFHDKWCDAFTNPGDWLTFLSNARRLLRT